MGLFGKKKEEKSCCLREQLHTGGYGSGRNRKKGRRCQSVGFWMRKMPCVRGCYQRGA